MGEDQQYIEVKRTKRTERDTEKGNGDKNGMGIVTVSFLVVLVLAVTVNIGAFFSTKTVSVAENRTLEEQPMFTLESYKTGEYFTQWERYIADHVPMREQVLQLVERIEFAFSLTHDNSIRIEQTTADIGVVEEKESVIIDDVLVSDDCVRELYHYSEEGANLYVQAVNAYATWLPNEISYYHMLVPMPIAFEEATYQQLSDKQDTAIAYVYNQLDERVQTVDVYERLSAFRIDEIYFRTDHHWNARGARCGAEAFAEVAGVMLPTLESYNCYTLKGFIGQLGLNHITDSLQNNPDEVAYYLYNNHNPNATMYYYLNGEKHSFDSPMINLKFNNEKGDYGIFISGDYPYTVVPGYASNDRVLAIVKDSYGNALVPWLVESFAKIIAIDPRTCQETFSELLDTYQVTDVLLLDYIKVTSMPAYSQILLDFIADE